MSCLCWISVALVSHSSTGMELTQVQIIRQQGGGYCTRVSCEEDSGIYVCNDNEFPIWYVIPIPKDQLSSHNILQLCGNQKNQ